MLLGNYNVFNKQPGRTSSGSSLSDTRAAWNKSGPARNIFLTWENDWPRTAALPNGCTPPYSWVLPQYSGGLSSKIGLTGYGAVANVNLAGGLNGLAALAGTGDITSASIRYYILAAAALLGTGVPTAAIQGNVSIAGPLTGSGDITAGLYAGLYAAAALSGVGDLAGASVGAIFAAADLAGATNLSAALAGGIQAAAALTGSAAVSTNVMAIWSMVGALSATGDIVAALRAVGNAVAALTGTGGVVGGVPSKANMSATINVTGDILSTANVADAIWSALATQFNIPGSMGAAVNNAGSSGNPWDTVLEDGTTAQDLMRLFAAVLLGTSTVSVDGNYFAFKSLDGTTERVIGIRTGRSRSGMTLDPS